MAVWTVYLSLCLLMALSASVESWPDYNKHSFGSRDSVGSRDCGVCRAGWSAYRCRCIRFFNQNQTWIDAEKSCLVFDGNLASVHSLGEYTFVQRLVRSATNTGTRAWIGGNDAVQEGDWLWSDGTQMNFQTWSPGNPNNDLESEHCLEMNYDNGNWNDDVCSEKKPFVCALNQHKKRSV